MKSIYEKPTAKVVNLAAMAQLAFGGDSFDLDLRTDDFFGDLSSGVDNDRT